MKISGILRVVIGIILFVDLKFYYIIPLPSVIEQLNNNHQKIIIVLIVILVFSCFLFKLINLNNLIFKKSIFYFIILYLIELIISWYRHNQGLMNVFISSNYYILLLSYFIFIYYLRKNSNNKAFKEKIININVFISVLFLLQYILIKFNVKFLQINFEYYRFGELRIYEAASMFVNLGVILALGNLLKLKRGKKNNCKSILCIILSLINIIIVAKGRMGLLIILCTMILMILYRYRKNAIKIFIAISIIGVVGLLFIRTDVAQEYIKSSQIKDASITNRQGAINMYVDQIKKNPIFGMGFIRDMDNSEAVLLLRGPKGSYTRTDVGIIGFTNTFGILGFAWYIYILIKFSYIILILHRKNVLNMNLELLGIFIMVILTSFTLIVMDSERILIMPIFMALLDYTVNKYKIKLKRG